MPFTISCFFFLAISEKKNIALEIILLFYLFFCPRCSLIQFDLICLFKNNAFFFRILFLYFLLIQILRVNTIRVSVPEIIIKLILKIRRISINEQEKKEKEIIIYVYNLLPQYILLFEQKSSFKNKGCKI